jgi:hypothetical protein
MGYCALRKIICLVVLALSVGFAQVTPVLALPVSVGFSPAGPTSVSPGNYSWNIVVSGLPTGQVVAAYDFDVLYNPSLLSINSVSFSQALGNPLSYQSTLMLNTYSATPVGNPTFSMDSYGVTSSNYMSSRDGSSVIPVPNGTIDISGISWLSGDDLRSIQNNDLHGGTIVLATLNFTALRTGSTSLSYDWYIGQDIKGYSGEVIGGSMPVPEPSSMLLFCSGIATLVLFRRKFNRCGRFFGK